MIATNDTTLIEIDNLLSRVLALTPYVHELLAGTARTEQARAEYTALGFTTVKNVLPSDAWTNLVMRLLPYLSKISEEVTLLHVATSDTTISDGARFRRVDPHCIHSPSTRAMMTMLLEKLGLVMLGTLLATKLTPLIHEIAGPLRYERSYFYIYEEGDYISIHNDHHVGDRVDVQFPLSMGTSGGVRILSQGHLHMRYDSAGSMNILGPGVWHDVPPLLRVNQEIAPQRFNMGLRFTKL